MNPSSVDDSTYDRKIVIMALMVALGVILHRLEALLPLPTPWIKLGLANLMTLVVLFYLGTREAFIVTLLRVILGSILAGTFLGPAFFFSAWQVAWLAPQSCVGFTTEEKVPSASLVSVSAEPILILSSLRPASIFFL